MTTGYKDILVFLDDTRQCAQRLDTAVDLAERFQARLTGLAAVQTAYVPELMTQELVQRQEEAARDRNRRLRGAFEERLGRSTASTEWRGVEQTAVGETVLDVLALHSRYADLVVVGQPDPEDGDDMAPNDLPGRLALVAGRPVLGVPYAWRPVPVGKRVLVAWNASREASRAVHDALPLLQGADEVRVLALTRGGGLEGHGDLPGADIATHLARHGVNVEAEHGVVEDIEVPEALLSAAADYGADLLVMGAYGHSRLREIVLGGASRGVLRHMTLPVLMAH